MAFNYTTRNIPKYRIGDTVLVSCQYTEDNPHKNELPSDVQITIDYIDIFGDYDGTCNDTYSLYLSHRFHFSDKDVIKLIERKDKRSDAQMMLQHIREQMTEIAENITIAEQKLDILDTQIRMLSDVIDEGSK